MRHLKLQLAMVAATVVLFAIALAINHWLFARLEFAAGINWVYLPAGVRLLATLLFAEAGAVGLLLVSWVVDFAWFFPDDPARAFVGGVVAAAVPYVLYLMARRVYGLQASLANLTPRRLLVLATAYAVAGPLLQHLYLAARGQAPDAGVRRDGHRRPRGHAHRALWLPCRPAPRCIWSARPALTR